MDGQEWLQCLYTCLPAYIPDPDNPPLKSGTVKSIIMVVFREGKAAEDEMKAWHFWHSRQHSIKQRILDADTKNSIGKSKNVFQLMFLTFILCRTGRMY